MQLICEIQSFLMLNILNMLCFHSFIPFLHNKHVSCQLAVVLKDCHIHMLFKGISGAVFTKQLEVKGSFHLAELRETPTNNGRVSANLTTHKCLSKSDAQSISAPSLACKKGLSNLLSVKLLLKLILTVHLVQINNHKLH